MINFTRPFLTALVATWAATAQAEFVDLRPAGAFSMTEHVEAGKGTMSGNHKHSIRTNRLFAGIQLTQQKKTPDFSDTVETVTLSELLLAPIVLPGDVAAKHSDKVKICAEVRTINGYYTATGGTKAEQFVRDSTAPDLINAAYESKHPDVKSEYSEDMLLMRAMVALDCLAGRSSYYVPVSLTRDPDTLLVVLEVGSGTVAPTLAGVLSEAGDLADPTPLSCAPSVRVESGYDCSIALKDIGTDKHRLWELSVAVTSLGEESTHRARLALPRLPN
ncbi:hypothetical protein shim_27320 [Shimia sp. SK013]|uniref:hypothetical protein n=1 Tax=Shimia sp. SK013 TaxID=1389006 RepID=UPI0006B527C0|nr:hypothetical protein [Shimia sp. SK013]KPA21267.1 hypothetical protein shim_27320 [Shimia sp. SK013]